MEKHAGKRYIVIELDVEVDEDGELTDDSREAVLDVEHAVDAIQTQIVQPGRASYMQNVYMHWTRKRSIS